MQNLQKIADDLILTKYSPPGVIVNEQYDIVQFRGMTGRWLEPLPGKASLNLLKMAREGLSFELRNILHKAKQTNISVVKSEVHFVKDGINETVNLEAVVLPGEETHYLVLFHEADGAAQPKGPYNAETMPEPSVDELRIIQLEHELMFAREDMRRITEDQEASNEALFSTSEELQTLIAAKSKKTKKRNPSSL